MQIIQGIRDKGAAIVIVVIALSLIGFILMDAKQGTSKLFNSSSSNIGKVNGSAIEQSDFNKKVRKLEDQQEQRYNRKVSAAETGEIREYIWNTIVFEKVFYPEASKLGIDFTSNELSAVLASNDPNNPLTQEKQLLDSATGKLDMNKIRQAFASIKKMTSEQRENFDAQVLEPLKRNSLQNKYMALLNASAYYPAWMEEKDSKENKNFAIISYVTVPYTVIKDSTIKVTDDDIEKYVQKNKDLFKQEAGRKISYVAFSQLPSADDSAKTIGAITALKDNFVADTNVKTFLARNVSLQPFNEDYVWKSKMQGRYKDSIELLQKGGVFGPYIEGHNYNLAKMVGIKQQPDSVYCRHILIKIADLKDGQVSNQIRPDSVARKLIDSIAIAIKGGANFNDMVLKYSDDFGSKLKKGEYGFSYTSHLVDSFYRTVFYEPVGTKKVVLGEDEASYVGYHYIEVLNQFKFEPAYKIAYMSKEIVASDATIQKASLDAIKLAAEKDPKKFDTAYLKKKGLTKITVPNLIKENDAQVGQLQDARQLVRWVFDAKKGDVCDPFNIGDQYVVAVVDKILDEGIQDAQTARPRAEIAIRDEKKGEEIIKKTGNAPTIESVSAAYAIKDSTTGTDSTIIFASKGIVNAIGGQEPKVIGACFNKENLTKVSSPILGKSGVYVLKVNSIGTKASDTPEQLTQRRNLGTSTLRAQASDNWYEGLKNQAGIKDNRSKFY